MTIHNCRYLCIERELALEDLTRGALGQLVRDAVDAGVLVLGHPFLHEGVQLPGQRFLACLLYTSDAADE